MSSMGRVGILVLFLASLPVGAASVSCGASSPPTFAGGAVNPDSSNGAFYTGSGGSGTVQFTFTLSSGCTYWVTTDSSWLISSAGPPPVLLLRGRRAPSGPALSNTGTSGSVGITVQSNSTGVFRTGHLFAYVNGSVVATIEIDQNSTNCAMTIQTANPMSVPLAGGTFTFTFSVNAGCGLYWGPYSSSPDWLNPTGYTSHSITYTVAPNTGASRSGSLTFNDPPAVYTVLQAGTTITITPTTLPAGMENTPYPNVVFTATGGTGKGYVWSVAGAPPGLTIGSSSGIFGGTPSPGSSAGSPYSVDISVTDSGGYSNSVGIPLVINAPPATGLTVSATSLSFSYIHGGAVPMPQSFTVSGVGGQGNFSTMASVTSGGNWLTASPGSGMTPTNVSVGLQNLGNVNPGTYQGSVVVSLANGAGSKTVSVTLEVIGSSPQLSLSTTDVRYTVNAGNPPFSGSIIVSNSGGGTLNYSASAGPVSWLSVTCGSGGSVTNGNPAQLCFQVSPSGLQAGTYTDTLAVVGGSQEIDAMVTLQVNAATTSIVLSATAMTFYAIQGAAGALPAVQSSAVLNSGSAAMSWTAALDKSTPTASWLKITSASGSSLPFGASQPAVTFTPMPQGLPSGNYYVLVDVTATGAANSPGQISILLKVLPAGSALPPALSSSGLVFTAPVGGAATALAPLSMTNTTSVSVNFTCVLSPIVNAMGQTVNATFLSAGPPATGTVGGGAKFPMDVSVTPSGLGVGIYYAELHLSFDNGTTENVGVTLLITPASSSPAAVRGSGAEAVTRDAATGCTNFGISFAQPYPSSGGSVVAGYSYVLQVSSLCVPQPDPNAAKVTILFSNGAPGLGANAYVPGDQVAATYNQTTGYYEFSWTPDPRSVGATPVKFYAQSNPTNAVGLPIASEAVSTPHLFSVTVTSPDPSGSPIPQGVSNAAFKSSVNTVAGGSFISIYGQQIATAPANGALPFNTVLGGVMATLGGVPMYLYYASPTQVNAIVPFLDAAALNTTQSLVVYNNCSPSGTGCVPAPPADMNLLTIQPGIFPYPENGAPATQGAIENQNAGFAVADPSHPAGPGDVIVIYCEGLGPVTNPPPAGTPTPGVDSSVNMPVVFIDGIQASTIYYSGLTPGEEDLYQVNVQVPPGIHAGTVNVQLQMTDPTTNQVIKSNIVTIN